MRARPGPRGMKAAKRTLNGVGRTGELSEVAGRESFQHFGHLLRTLFQKEINDLDREVLIETYLLLKLIRLEHCKLTGVFAPLQGFVRRRTRARTNRLGKAGSF